jgi:hypothetical protein
MQDALPLKGDLMVVQWMRDVIDIAEVRRLSDGALVATVPQPTLGTMSGMQTEPLRVSTQFWYSLETFLEPSAVYRADAATTLPPANGACTASSPSAASLRAAPSAACASSARCGSCGCNAALRPRVCGQAAPR